MIFAVHSPCIIHSITYLQVVVRNSIDRVCKEVDSLLVEVEVGHVQPIDLWAGPDQVAHRMDGVRVPGSHYMNIGVIDGLVQGELVNQLGHVANVLRFIDGLHAQGGDIE